MKIPYQGEYDFQCKNLLTQYAGKSCFSFVYDDDTNEVSNMGMNLECVTAFDLIKEVEISIIRNYMLKIIEALIHDDVVECAISHNLS